MYVIIKLGGNMKILKSRLFLVLITAVICICSTAYAVSLTATSISYGNGTVKDALDDLYTKRDSGNLKLCKFIDGTYGAKGTVGAKYECTLGDKDANDNLIKRNFYILSVNQDNTVDMIMDRNITEGTENKKVSNWNSAMNYFSSGQPGYKYTTAWTLVVSISLPSSVKIARAVDNNNWNVNDNWFCFGLKDQSSCIANSYANATQQAIEAVQNYKWLFNYCAECSPFGCDNETSLDSSEANGYWCKDNWKNTSNAMIVDKYGRLNDTSVSNQNFGVRPVITVLKSSLYE